MKLVGAHFPEPVHRQLRVLSAQEGRTVQSVIAEVFAHIQRARDSLARDLAREAKLQRVARDTLGLGAVQEHFVAVDSAAHVAGHKVPWCVPCTWFPCCRR